MDQRLRERVRPLNDPVPPRHGEFVLYWCATALRAEENPALEVAIAEANARRLPVLAWQGLTCGERYASDRLFRFVLEGVPGLARDLAARGVRHVFHLERGRRAPSASPRTCRCRRSSGQLRRGWRLEHDEERRIVEFHDQHPLEGHRRLAFRMIDQDVVAASASTVYRVLDRAGRRSRSSRSPRRRAPASCSRSRCTSTGTSASHT